MFLQKKCPKGRECNYLHVFKDPTSEFRQSNYDSNLNKHKNKQISVIDVKNFKNNEWSSPEIDEKYIKNVIFDENKNDELRNSKKKREKSRSRSIENRENSYKRHKDIKKHKKKKKKKHY